MEYQHQIDKELTANNTPQAALGKTHVNTYV